MRYAIGTRVRATQRVIATYPAHVTVFAEVEDLGTITYEYEGIPGIMWDNTMDEHNGCPTPDTMWEAVE